jgi:hypothetical protein
MRTEFMVEQDRVQCWALMNSHDETSDFIKDREFFDWVIIGFSSGTLLHRIKVLLLANLYHLLIHIMR